MSAAAQHALPGRLAWASLVACGLMMSVPFVVPIHYFPVPTFRAEFAAVALGLAALALFVAGGSWREARLPLTALLPLGLALILLTQFYSRRTASPQLAVIALGYLAWSASLVALGASLAASFGRERISRVLAWCVLLGGVALALLAVAQVLDGPRSVFGALPQRASATLGQPNHVASGAALGLASALYLLGIGVLPSVLAAVLGALLLLALSLAGSRSAWLYLAAFPLIAAWLFLRRRDPESRRLLLAAILTLPLLAGLQLALEAWWPATLAAGERLFDAAAGVEQRLRLWREAWLMFLDAPLAGIGYGNFPWRHYLLALALPGGAAVDGIYGHAHNLFLQLLAEFGLGGFLLAAGGLALWVSGFLRRPADAPGWWLAAVLAVLFVHSLLEYPLWYAYFLGTASVLLGAGDGRCIRLRPSAGTGLARAGVLAGAVLGIAGATALLRSYGELADLFAKLDARAGGSRPPQAAQLREPLFDLHQRSLLAPYVEVRLAGLLPLDREQLDRKLELNTSAMRLFPSHVATYRQAVLLALKGDQGAAVAQLDGAVAAHPSYLGRFVPVLERLAEREPGLAPLLAAAQARAAGR